MLIARSRLGSGEKDLGKHNPVFSAVDKEIDQGQSAARCSVIAKFSFIVSYVFRVLGSSDKEVQAPLTNQAATVAARLKASAATTSPEQCLAK